MNNTQKSQQLYRVPKEIFDNYVKEHVLKPVSGPYTHMTSYLDSNGEVVATKMSSSYSSVVEYRIPDPNWETISVLNKLTR